MRSLPLLLAAAATISAAQAQLVSYAVQPGSILEQEFCLPPCLCPYQQRQGPISGGFAMTLQSPGPLYDVYAVTGVSWVAQVGSEVVTIVGMGTYERGGEVALMHRLRLDLTVGPLQVIEHFDSGYVIVDPAHPFPALAIETTTGAFGCRRDTITLIAAPAGGACYPNCDGSTTVPVLNVLDFSCFLNKFAAADPWANCDGSTTAPALNVLDFSCFLNKFAAGCG
jgi:hypothetical protein